MKSVLISIQSYYVFLIVARIIGWDIPQEKIIEVRKDYPKDSAWNRRVDIYCSKNRKSFKRIPKQYQPFMAKLLGKVVGQFVCDRIEKFYCCCVPYRKTNNLGYGNFLDDGVYKCNTGYPTDDAVVFERDDIHLDTMLKNNDLSKMCLSAEELYRYVGLGNEAYAWHISDLKIYDTPKEFGEFVFTKKCRDARYFEICRAICGYAENSQCNEGIITERITRPPQSWQYVEELEYEKW